MRFSCLTLAFLCTYLTCRGQNFFSSQYIDRYYTLSTGVGFASYRGELKHNGSIQNEVSQASLGIEARLLPKISARFDVGWYSIRGHDKHAPDSSFAKQRNLSFTSSNWEASLQGVFYLKKYNGDYRKRKTEPYLMVGIGTTYFSPRAELDSTTYNLYEFQTEDATYPRWTFIIPMGAGLKFKVNDNLNFVTEINYRLSFSDYLDDVSGDFPTSYPDELTRRLSNRKNENPIVNQEAYDKLISGERRGNAKTKDSYLFLSLKLEYYLPPSIFQR